MFDHKPTDGFYFNAMVANSRQANENASIAQEWKAHAQKLEAQLANMTLLWQKATMAKAGFRSEYLALRDALKQLSPQHSLVSDSGKRFKDGRIKTNVHLLWEKAYDEKGVELRISRPQDHRED